MRPLDRNGIAVCAALSLLMASHLLWLLLAASAYTAPPYRMFWEAALFVAWALTQVPNSPYEHVPNSARQADCASKGCPHRH